MVALLDDVGAEVVDVGEVDSADAEGADGGGGVDVVVRMVASGWDSTPTKGRSSRPWSPSPTFR